MTRKQITNVLKYKQSTKNQMNVARRLSMRDGGDIRLKSVYNTHKQNRKQHRKQKTYKPHQKHIKKKKIWKNKEYGGAFTKIHAITFTEDNDICKTVNGMFSSYNDGKLLEDYDNRVKEFINVFEEKEKEKENLTKLSAGAFGILFTFDDKNDEENPKRVLKVCRFDNAREYKQICREVTVGLDDALTSDTNPIVPKISNIQGFSSNININKINSIEKTTLNTIDDGDWEFAITGVVLFEQEWCESSLADSIQNKTLTIEQKIDISKQLVVKMQEYHENGYVHRDTKPGNLLIKKVNQKDVLFICDHGYSAMHKKPITMRDRSASESIRCPDAPYTYWSDELVNSKNLRESTRIDMHKVDAWGVGMCLLELFTDPNVFQLHCYKRSKFQKFKEALFENLRNSIPTQDFITCMWLKIIQFITERLLKDNPQERIYLSEATKIVKWFEECVLLFK